MFNFWVGFITPTQLKSHLINILKVNLFFLAPRAGLEPATN